MLRNVAIVVPKKNEDSEVREFPFLNYKEKERIYLEKLHNSAQMYR